MAALGGLPRPVVMAAVESALREDLGHGARDITTEATVPASATARAVLAARSPLRLAGLQCAETAFAALDPAVRLVARHHDGDAVAGGGIVAEVTGPAHAVLGAERVALNFLGWLSGIATATATAVAATTGTAARITGTRKTTPGWRRLESYAIRCGGGRDHRLGLDDGVLIKDNHIALAGGVTAAVTAARQGAGHMARVAVEVEDATQLDAALAAGAEVILLDNMDLDALAAAVRRIDGRAVAEASGGLTPAEVAAVAATGVDVISLGWLTHSAPAADIGLDITDS